MSAEGVAHMLVLPWPAQGHINPAMSIAEYLAASGIQVTFVYTERSQKSQVGGCAGLNIQVVPDHNAEATQKGLEELVHTLQPRPFCLLVDAFFPWSHNFSARLCLPRVLIWPGSVYAFAIGLHIPDLITRGFLPIADPGCMEKIVDFIPGLTPFKMRALRPRMTVSDLGSPALKFFKSLFEHIRKGERLLVHTMYELESTAIDALKEHACICMEPIGPLISSSRHSLLSEDFSCLSWLNKQNKASVLYIAFGSSAFLEKDALLELAYGLEASKQPFLWVVLPNEGAQMCIEEMFPQSLISLMNEGKGLFISWAPQIQVLNHPSVGAFLSHCGWNSTLESLHLGVPILGFPQGKDQSINLKCIVHDWKAGLALQEENYSDEKPIDRAHVEKMVRAMMIGDEGREAKRGAMECAKLAKKAFLGSSKGNLQKLVDDIKQGCLQV